MNNPVKYQNKQSAEICEAMLISEENLLVAAKWCRGTVGEFHGDLRIKYYSHRSSQMPCFVYPGSYLFRRQSGYVDYFQSCFPEAFLADWTAQKDCSKNKHPKMKSAKADENRTV